MLPLFTNLQFKQFPWVTYTLIMLNIAAFIGEMALRDSGILGYTITHWTFTVGKGEIALATGYPDLLFHAVAGVFVYMFLHGNVIHLLTNMPFLFALGPAIEARLGKVKFLCFYLASGICAALFFAQIESLGNGLIGASGAMAAVVGAFLVFWPKARITSLMGVKVMTSNALVMLLDYAGLQFTAYYFSDGPRGVAITAHIGGFLFGALFATTLRFSALFRSQPAQVVLPPYQKELYDDIADWLEAFICNCWRSAVRLISLPVRKFKSNS